MSLPIDVNDCNYRKYRETSKGVAVAVTDDSLPTDGNNAPLVLAYDVDGNLSTITKTINSVQYQKTLTYTGGSLTGVSSWQEV